MKKAIVWIIVLLVLAAGGTYWYQKKKPEAEAAGPAYETASVERRDLRTTVESTGEVEPRNRLNVKPPIAGRLEELAVDEGDHVQKGQILGWISSTERATLLDAALATSKEELEYWQELYKPTPLVCPLEGTVIARNFEPGQTISANDTIVVIADDLIVVANLDETDIGLIKPGQSVEVTLEAYPDKTFPCEVEKIAYDAETVSNVTMYEVDVRPVNLPAFARSGMTANLEFIIEERKNALTLPTSAVQQKTAERVAPSPAENEGENLREKFQSMSPDERKAVIMQKMRERGLSDAEIKERLQRFAAGGGPGNGSGGGRPGGMGMRKPAVSAEQSYVLVGSMEKPVEKEIKTGVSDGSYIEITEGLDEGDSVLIQKVSLGSGQTGGSLFMPRPRSGGPRK